MTPSRNGDKDAHGIAGGSIEMTPLTGVPGLEGRVLLVTGAARGIGGAVAREAALAGAHVVGADLDTAEFPEGSDAIACVTDLTTQEGVDHAVDTAVSTFGRIDGVVSCAGVLTLSPLIDLDVPEWELNVRSHLTSQYLLLRSAARAMAPTGGGSVLLYSSHSALIGSDAAAYSTVKAGVLGLVRSAARTLLKDGVLVNGILPGASTRMTDAIFDANRHLDVPGLAIRSEDAAGTWRDPRNTAAAALYLVSSANSDITGQFFAVVGDQLSRLAPPAYRDISALEHGVDDRAERIAEAGRVIQQMPGVHDGVPDLHWPPR